MDGKLDRRRGRRVADGVSQQIAQDAERLDEVEPTGQGRLGEVDVGLDPPILQDSGHLPHRRADQILGGVDLGMHGHGPGLEAREIEQGGDEVTESVRLLLDRERVPVTAERALRSEEHTSELQSLAYLVCRLLLEKKK